MKTKLILSIIITVAINTVLHAQSYGSFTDTRDGKIYKTVKIGSQVWMAENLNFSPNSGSWCYENEDSLCDTYGRLYEWKVSKYVCPRGWHLPSKSEFETLLSNVGGSGSNAFNALKDGGSSGFSALFGGWRNSNGNFSHIGYGGYWWSSSEIGSSYAWILAMFSGSQNASMHHSGKAGGFSVRCLQD